MSDTRFVKAEDLQVGMVLADDVVLGKHHCVACSGWVITTALRQHMLSYGVGAAVADGARVSAQRLQEREQVLREALLRRMGTGAGAPQMQRLLNVMVEHRLRQGYGD